MHMSVGRSVCLSVRLLHFTFFWQNSVNFHARTFKFYMEVDLDLDLDNDYDDGDNDDNYSCN